MGSCDGLGLQAGTRRMLIFEGLQEEFIVKGGDFANAPGRTKAGAARERLELRRI